jgi:uncharacterized protein (TIGR03437 family)
MNKRSRAYAAAALLLLSTVSAQVMNPVQQNITLTGRDGAAVLVAAGAPTTLIPFMADPSSSGDDLFDINASDPAAVVSLILPSGLEVTAANSVALGFAFVMVPGGAFSSRMIPTPFAAPGIHILIRLPPGLPPGTYSVKLDGAAATAAFLATATYYSSSSVRTAVTTNGSSFRVGDSVVLSGLVFDGSAPVAGATMTARINDPTSAAAPVTVTLADAGPLDAAPGDGVYTGTYAATTPGAFTVVVRATGTSGATGTFSRLAVTDFRVLPTTARFTSFRNAAVSFAGSSKTDQLAITAAVAVTNAGSYQFGVTLVASNGSILKASSVASLSAGAGTIAVAFAASDIVNLGVNGPYFLHDAILISRDDPDFPVADYRTDAGPTAAYPLSSFNLGALYFTGQTTAAGVDDGTGKFATLRVDAQVSASAPGHYNWTGTLVNSAGLQLDAVDGSGDFVAGNNTATFVFDGTKLGKSCASGPLKVQSVAIYGSGLSRIVDQLFQSQSFSAAMFPGGTCLGAAPNAITATGSGLPIPIFKALAVAATGGVTAFNAAAAVSGNVNWLTVSPPGGSAPLVLTVALNPGGLAPGVYTGSVTLTAVGATNSPVAIPVTFTVPAPLAMSARPASLSFSVQAGPGQPPAQTIAVSADAPSVPFVVSAVTADGRKWLAVTPNTGVTPTSLGIAVDPSQLPPGTHTGTITILPTIPGPPPLAVGVTVTVLSPPPVVTDVLHGATLAKTAVAPGMRLILRGTNIGPVTPAQMQLNPDGTVATSVGGTRVLFDGVPAPILSTSSTETIVIVPYEVQGDNTTHVQVERAALSSITELAVAAAAPGIFTADSSGTGQGAISNEDGTANSDNNPTKAGSVIMIALTGEGQTIPPGVTGVIPSPSATTPAAPVTVTFDGQPADVGSLAETQDPGILHVSARIPADASSGDVAVLVTVGAVASQAGVTVAVQ